MEKDKKQYIINQFIQQMGYTPNIDNPKTFNEKMQWLKLYYQDPLMTKCADKYAVRNYVSKVIGEDYLIPLLGIYDNVGDIDFNSLPKEFVLKLNNGSGEIIICKDKSLLVIDDVKSRLDQWLKPETNHYYYSYEWCYKNIKSKIVCEKYLNSNEELLDYKFMCFHGEVKLLYTCSDRSRNLKVDFYDLEWNKLPFKRDYPNSNKVIEKPKNFGAMIKIAETLSQAFPFVRADLYEFENKVYFGELTFHPGNGMKRFEPIEWDYKLGEYLKLYSYAQKTCANTENGSISELLINDYNLDLFETVTPSGESFSMYVAPRFVQCYAHGYEQFSTKLVKNFVKDKDLFVDVGANYGYYSLVAAKANRDIKIIAIEPIAENFKVLNKNLIQNNIDVRCTRCINAAVLSSSGKAKFYKSEASDNSSVLPHPKADVLEQFEVIVVSLDDILKHEQYKNLFIKLDAKGRELEALKGLSATFEKCDNITILLKMVPNLFKLAGANCEEVVEYLISKGFNVYGIDERESKYYPLESEENLCKFESENSFVFNALCIKKEKSLSVAFFSHSAGLAGAERSLVDLVQDLGEQGVLCSVVLPGDGPLKNTLLEVGASVHVLTGIGEGYQWVTSESQSLLTCKENFIKCMGAITKQSIGLLKLLRPDVIYSQTIVMPWGALCAEILLIPHAWSICEYGELDHHLKFYFGFEQSMKALYESSDVVFSITQSVKNITLAGLHGQNDKVHVVYRKVRIGPMPEGALASERSQHDSKQKFKIGVFGTIHESKGQEDIVKAGIELLRNGHKVEVYLYGYKESGYLSGLLSLIKNSGFEDCFIAGDFLEHPYEEMKRMDVVVSCSRNEAFGRTLIEAILLKKPIIYAASGGPKEIFVDQEHGLAYTPGDHLDLQKKLLYVIENTEETAKRVERALEYVRNKFTAESYSKKIERSLRALKKTAQRQSISSVYALLADNFIQQIASLNQAVAERDGRIASLNQQAAEREDHIASLNQAVAERDRQIASLNQGVAERDRQIASLNQA